jgi:N-acetylglucosamine kinase-like BadF-type ATPase
MSLFLCVDCGGSKTSAVICDASGEVQGRALGGPSNFAYLGIDAFAAAVQVAVSNALKTCVAPPSVDPVPLPPPAPLFAAAWLGVSGVDSQGAIDTITPVLAALLGVPPGRRLLVCNDTHLLAAPLQMHDDVACAVACIAGTGGIVVSFTHAADGTLTEMGRVGGWGWVLGDEGGGFHVGREAVRQIVLRADVASVEGRKPAEGGADTLERRVMEHFGLASDVYELLTAVHLPDPAPGLRAVEGSGGAPAYALMPREKRLSQLAPLVFRSAFEDGDPLAIRVLHIASAELVNQIAILCRPDAPRGIKPSEGVICFGGSLVKVEKYRNMVLEQLAERGHVFKRVEFVDDAAAVGAKGLVTAATGNARK